MLCCIFFCNAFSFAQTEEKTTPLSEVEIRTYRSRVEGVGKKQEYFDSLQMQRYTSTELSKLLAQESGIYIKSYGPGNIATGTLRGGNASQIAVVWNGINIQNRMLSQLDLSQMPVFMFDQVGIDYGGSSASWGSGAVAGSILLNSNTELNKGKSLLLFGSAGSFNQGGLGFRFTNSNMYSASTTRVFVSSAANNYRYALNDADKLQVLKHANSQLASVLQEFKRQLPGGRSISINIWLTGNQRLLPNYITNQSKAQQIDNTIRSNVRYERYHKKTKSSAMLALLRDGISYNDSSSAVYNKSAVASAIVETDNLYHWKTHVLNYALNLTGSTANSEAYGGNKQMYSLAAMLANRFSFKQEKLILLVSARQEMYSTKSLPFTCNIGTTYRIKNRIVLQANAAKVFRQPSFNELYWVPGGNPQLKPEKGYSADGNLIVYKNSMSWNFKAELTAYARLISNWILWLPGANGQASPLNVQEVFSRGTETKWLVSHISKKHSLSFQLHSAYVLSTVRKSSIENDASLGKQLIYTPRYSGNAVVHYRYKLVFAEWMQQYAGYRFTASDNAAWLMPYTVANVRLGIEASQKLPVQIVAQCNNVFNQNYAIVSARPLPLRNYQLQVIYKLKIKATEKKQAT